MKTKLIALILASLMCFNTVALTSCLGENTPETSEPPTETTEKSEDTTTEGEDTTTEEEDTTTKEEDTTTEPEGTTTESEETTTEPEETTTEHTHAYTKEVVDAQYLKTEATCTASAVYYKSCDCGAKGRETFESGEPKGHTYASAWSYNQTYHWHEATCGHTSEESQLGEHRYGDDQICDVCAFDKTPGSLIFKTLTQSGTELSKTVPNATQEFSFRNEIEISGNATYVVSMDRYGIQTVVTKTIPLREGDNTVYVIEVVGDDTTVYTVTIRRRPMYTVEFNTNGGTAVASQTVEEDGFVTVPTTTKTGYTFVGWDRNLSAPITENTTVTASWTNNPYVVTYDANGGNVANATTNVGFDQAYTLETPTRVGYTFAGWLYGTTLISTNGTWTIAENVTLTAKWMAHTDIPYVVKHYTEKLDGTYELKDTDNLTGTTDSQVTPNTKTYPGFTAPTAQTVTVAADGSLVVEYRYTRNSYTIGFVTNGGDSISSQTLKYDQSLSNAVRSGFTFGGWFADEQLTQSITTMPAGDTTLYAYWNEENKPSDFTYSGTSSITISKYTGSDTTVCVPSYIGGIAVTSIGSDAFYDCRSLTSVTIPDSVTSIGSSAFCECSSLTSITIPNSVTSIGYYAFEYCHKLVEVINHSSLNITAGASSNGYVAYYAKEVHSGTSKIVNVNDYLFYTYDNVNYLLGYVGSNTELTLPANYNGQNYEIYQRAFYDRDDLTSVIIPNSVTSIGEYAFYFCNGLTSVTIGNSVTSIGDEAFYYCRSLTSITIPNSVTSIGSDAFRGCSSLTSVTIGNSVTSILEDAFYNCSKLVEVINHSSLNITKGSSNYGSVAYYAIEVHSGTSKIVKVNDYLFYTYNNVNYLFGYVGADTELILPESYNGQNYEIYQYAFSYRTDLTNVTIPNSVTSIGGGAFSSCSSLTSVTIGIGVTSIGDYAFGNIGYSLNSIKYRGSRAQWDAVSKELDWNYITDSFTITYNYTGD